MLPDKSEQLYSDAIALQFPKEDAYGAAPVEKPLFRHGDAQHHTTIWYWNAGSAEPRVESRTALFDASGPNSKLTLRKDAGDLVTRGEWQDGRWRVLFKRPRGTAVESSNESLQDSATDPGDLVFRKGQFIPVSFANWDGNNGEAGSKHTLTPWFWLLLPQETNYGMVYGASLSTSLAFLMAGMTLVWRMRRKSPVRSEPAD